MNAPKYGAGGSRWGRRSGRTHAARQAFLNVPYDSGYEDLYLAFIAGLCGFGLTPRATIEIPSSDRRLDRIIKLIRSCGFSFHDLSRVELDRHAPFTPRFNMPFELGLAVDWARTVRAAHQWFVLESEPHRLEKSLSDINGTDPFVHGGSPRGVLAALSKRAVAQSAENRPRRFAERVRRSSSCRARDPSRNERPQSLRSSTVPRAGYLGARERGPPDCAGEALNGNRRTF